MDLPTVDIGYYVLPSSQYKSAHLQQFLDTVVNLQLVKVITLFLILPSGQTELVRVFIYHALLVHVLILYLCVSLVENATLFEGLLSK